MARWIRFTGTNAWAAEHRGGDDGRGGHRFDRSPCPTVNAFAGGLGGSASWRIEDDGLPEDPVARRVVVRATGQVGKRSEEQTFSFDDPAPTVQRCGFADQRPRDVLVVDDGLPEEAREVDGGKPPYRVPLLGEIRAVPRNGMKVMSTFSGCGGSCLGFEWAGYEPLLAVEFVPSAVESYEANHPGVPVYSGDIRALSAGEALDLMGLNPEELDVLEGSPPCESFSTAGRLSEKWGTESSYSDGKKQVMDDLFFEFTRLLGGIRPRAFVAENVSGLVRGVSKGYFKRIHAALAAQGYRVEARMLDAQWLGVPQRRRRVIFVGVRDDLGIDPAFPDPLPYRYSIRDAIGDGVAGVEHDTSGQFSEGELDMDAPVPTITNGVKGLNSYHFKVRDAAMVEGGRPLAGNFLEEWEGLEEGGQSGRYRDLVRADAEEPSPTILRVGGASNRASATHPSEPRKFSIPELMRLCGFPDDFKLSGNYAQQWERMGNSVPPPMMFHVATALAAALRPEGTGARRRRSRAQAT